MRITWGGARLYDRYREAIWNGSIVLSGDASIENILPFSGLEGNAEDYATGTDDHTIGFHGKTSGDTDGADITLPDDKVPSTITITGSLSGYVKLGMFWQETHTTSAYVFH
jgi:hypothetical protein